MVCNYASSTDKPSTRQDTNNPPMPHHHHHQHAYSRVHGVLTMLTRKQGSDHVICSALPFLIASSLWVGSPTARRGPSPPTSIEQRAKNRDKTGGCPTCAFTSSSSSVGEPTPPPPPPVTTYTPTYRQLMCATTARRSKTLQLAAAAAAARPPPSPSLSHPCERRRLL